MGMKLIMLYNRIRKEWKLAFFSALIIGMLAHIYKFTNTLPNHDALYNMYSNQNMIRSGRWLLTPACIISSYFDLPWITGFLAIVFLGLSAVVLVELFELDNPAVIILVSGLTVTFPAVTETFFYEYTSDGYMFAMFIASCAVLISKTTEISYVKMLLSAPEDQAII